jgi:hypothetical protein
MMVKRNLFSILLTIIITLCVSVNSVSALKNQFNLQARLYASVPILELGIPMGTGDYFEVGYGKSDYNGVNYYIPLVYSWQLSASANERSALRIGVMFYHNDNPWLFNKDGTFPILLYEQESTINSDAAWVLNFGFPNLIGVGLKWYFN